MSKGCKPGARPETFDCPGAVVCWVGWCEKGSFLCDPGNCEQSQWLAGLICDTPTVCDRLSHFDCDSGNIP